MLVADGGDLLLASCSQDSYVRLWRLTLDGSTDAATGEIVSRERRFSVQTEGQRLRSNL